MPSKKLKEGEFKDVFHPINSEVRQLLQDEIIGFYNNYNENEALNSESDSSSNMDDYASEIG